MFARPALIIYAFAPKELPSYPDLCTHAHEYLKELWGRCSDFGMNEAVPKLVGLTTEFPAAIDVNDPHFRLVAAKVDLKRKANNEDYHAFLFEYQDIFGLVATLESNSQVETLSEWNSLLETWTTKVGSAELSQGIMEETYLFTVLHESDTFSSDSWLSFEHFFSDIALLGKQVIESLPGSKNAPWRSPTFWLTDSGYCIWGGENLNSRRTVALVAPQAKKDNLFHWTVRPNRNMLAPFTAYLMHAAKLRYAQHTFQTEVLELRKNYRPLDDAVNELFSLCQRSVDDGMWDLNEIENGYNKLLKEQMRKFDLSFGISKLKELMLTTRIAKRNLQKLMPAKHSAMTFNTGSVFEHERARGVWLSEQMDMDLGYLSALGERVEEAHKMMDRVLHRESQKTTRRLKSLVLVQVTLYGSLTIGLLMLPAFDIFAHAHDIVVAVLFLLMAIAGVLPTLFERWHEDYTRFDHIAAGLLCATAFFFGLTLWEYVSLPVYHVPKLTYFGFLVFICIIGFLVGFFGLERIERLKGRKRFRNGEDQQNKTNAKV